MCGLQPGENEDLCSYFLWDLICQSDKKLENGSILPPLRTEQRS